MLDKLKNLFQRKTAVDVETRFQRLRSAVSGTMSNFFVAKDNERNEVVGVKLCDAEKVKFFESRFKGLNKPAEGVIATAMKHPLIAQTYEFGTTNKGLPYLVMEFIDGPGLQVVIQERNMAIRGKELDLIRQMGQALDYVHKNGYIHRDICPRNYICTQNLETIKLIDFGLTVPATPPFMREGNRTGTPLYMAPEIVRRRPTDKRVDVFSFGVTLYHMLTFELPWPITDTTGMAALHHDTSPPRPIWDYRPNLDKFVGKAVMEAMQPNPSLRTDSIDTFLKQIAKVRTIEG
jgi:eukaryotic-like serine/threonine-protein kinase